MTKTSTGTGNRKKVGRTLRAHTPSGGVTVKVDPALKRRWDFLIGAVRKAQKDGAIEFDHLWEAIGEIIDHELYLLGGFKDAADFFERELGEKQRNAYRYIRVAKFASPRDESRYGVTKLDAALSFIEAKVGAPLAHPPLPIAFDKLRVPHKEGKSLSLDDARVSDIETATRASTKPPRSYQQRRTRARPDLRQTRGFR